MKSQLVLRRKPCLFHLENVNIKCISVLRRKPKEEHPLGNITKLSAALREAVIFGSNPKGRSQHRHVTVLHSWDLESATSLKCWGKLPLGCKSILIKLDANQRL